MNSMTERRALLGSEKNDREMAGRRRQMLRLVVTLAVALATAASAQTYTVLKTFNGSDGAYPRARLVLAGSALYGTAYEGGTWNDNATCGVIFHLDMDGSGYTVLKDFSGSDGRNPWAGVVLSKNIVYGTTQYGGTSDYYGVVFRANTDGSGYTVLKSFPDGGTYPSGNLVLAGSTLYGTAELGGTSSYAFGCGTVFRINTDGSGFAVLKNFDLSDGANPHGLVLSGSTLYGTAECGGSFGYGVVFKLNIDGSGFAVLKSFTGSDGRAPFAGLVLSGSTLYGTTAFCGTSGDAPGCGTVFKITTDGTGYAVLKSFSGSDGSQPYGDLVLAGSTLYGTAECGGSPGDSFATGYGVVFQVNTDGSGYTVLKHFTGSDGANPQAGLVLSGGTLYGTAASGGSSGDGVVFSLTIAPPSITWPPLTQTAETGSHAFFSAEVTNTSPGGTYYQWYFSGTNALGSATNSYLALANVQPAQAGAYTVVVTNIGGAVTSAPALLSVIPPVDRRVVPAVHLPGNTGSLLHLEYADSLAALAWSSFTNVTLGSGPQLCFDLSQPLPEQRFYRTWQTNGPQPALDLSMATEIPLAGAIGSSVRIDYINQFGPTDAWVTLDTVTLTNTSQLYFDTSAWGQPTRLYRLVPSP
jgi:uncharacterized repeat protein (TIGR03803 family)